MTSLQAYLIIAPIVLFAIAGAVVWWTGQDHRHHLHPGE